MKLLVIIIYVGKVKTITKLRILSYWNDLLSDKQAKLFCIVHCLSAYFNSALKSIFWKKVFKNGHFFNSALVLLNYK